MDATAPVTRRRFVQAGGLLAGAVSIGGCAVASAVRSPRPPAPAFALGAITLGPMRAVPIRTGSVAVKRAHREYGGPSALRLPAIAFDPRWTPWLPITCWLIDHPDGHIVVDTGETARTADPDYFGCDAATAFVYENLLRFDVAPRQEIGPQLRGLGVEPRAVRTVALTHLHSDHAGGLGHFPQATFLLSRAEAEQPSGGAVACRWPSFFEPTPVDYADGQFGAFASSHALTSDGAVRLVPTPGHTRGHQSVLLQHEGRWLLLAGDASFSREQVVRRAVAGICEDVPLARHTLHVIAEQLEGAPTAYVAAHDPAPDVSAVRASG